MLLDVACAATPPLYGPSARARLPGSACGCYICRGLRGCCVRARWEEGVESAIVGADGVPVRAPSREAMRAWLDSSCVVGADGTVLSWVSASHPGFPYPEAAAIWLAWAAWRRDRFEVGASPARIEAVAGRLWGELQSGPVGKEGRGHLFDTCLAVAALARWTADGGAGAGIPGSSHVARAGLRALERFLDAGEPVLPMPIDPDRWSGRWGPFLDRAAAFLDQASIDLEDPRFSAVADAVRARVLPANGETGYVHARAYALEGWAMSGAGLAFSRAVADLAAWQGDGGALPAWAGTSGPGRADATAQAVRLWSRFPFPGARRAIERGLAALARFQVLDGGLRYEEAGADINTWATAFADQAVAWGLGVLDGMSPADEAWV